MSFFGKNIYSISKNFLFHSKLILIQDKLHSKKTLERKRTSPSVLGENASLTLEAAFVFPVFLSVCMMILFFAELFRLETRVSELLFNSSKAYAQYAGLLANEEISENVLLEAGIKGFSIYAISSSFKEQLGDDFSEQFLMAKANTSFSFGYSKIDENYVDLIVVYGVRFNVPFVKLPEIPIVQRCKIHSWSGKEKEEVNEAGDTIVYVALNGQVYHKSRDCTYINISVNSVKYNEVSTKRNVGGAKYYACERCIKNENVNSVVYITNSGTRYHNSLNCSELKRTVYEVKLSDVKDSKRECSKCG